MARKGFRRLRNEDIIKAYQELQNVLVEKRPISEMSPEEILDYKYYMDNKSNIEERYDKHIRKAGENAQFKYNERLGAIHEANPITTKKVEAMLAKEKRKLDREKYKIGLINEKPKSEFQIRIGKLRDLWNNRGNLLADGKEHFSRDMEKAKTKSVKAMKHIAVKGRKVTIKGAMKLESLKDKRRERTEKIRKLFSEIDEQARKEIEEEKKAATVKTEDPKAKAVEDPKATETDAKPKSNKDKRNLFVEDLQNNGDNQSNEKKYGPEDIEKAKDLESIALENTRRLTEEETTFLRAVREQCGGSLDNVTNSEEKQDEDDKYIGSILPDPKDCVSFGEIVKQEALSENENEELSGLFTVNSDNTKKGHRQPGGQEPGDD